MPSASRSHPPSLCQRYEFQNCLLLSSRTLCKACLTSYFWILIIQADKSYAVKENIQFICFLYGFHLKYIGIFCFIIFYFIHIFLLYRKLLWVLFPGSQHDQKINLSSLFPLCYFFPWCKLSVFNVFSNICKSWCLVLCTQRSLRIAMDWVYTYHKQI